MKTEDRAKVLFVTFQPGLAGPQRWLDAILRAPEFERRIDARVWHVEDCYRGLAGKWRLLQRCRQLLKESRSHCVYISHDLNVAAQVVVAMRILKAPRIILHSRSSCFPNERGLKKSFYQRFARLAHPRLAVSEGAAIAMWGPDPAPWLEHQAGIDFAKLWKDSENGSHPQPHHVPFTFACIGRLSKEKNQQLAIRALARLKGAGIAARLFVIGEGSDRTFLQQTAVRQGVDADVEFPGNIESIGAWYRHKIDAVLIPSHYEGQCQIAAEAQFFGLPVIASSAIPVGAYLHDRRRTILPNLEVRTWCEAMADTIKSFNGRSEPHLSALDHPRLSIGASIATIIKLICDEKDDDPGAEISATVACITSDAAAPNRRIASNPGEAKSCELP